jgi:hypothetical protein
LSKRALKKYLNDLDKEQLEEQIMDLYERFKEVKTYYNFAFNPNEDKLMEDAKFKISKEYFPLSRRRPKMRRSIAQKLIKNFITLGVDSIRVADLMLYTIEIALIYSRDHTIRQVSFYKSILTSFEQAVEFIQSYGIWPEFKERIDQILNDVDDQEWVNTEAFERAILYKHTD